MKNTTLLFFCLGLFTACSGTRGEVRLTREPSIERAFDILNATELGKPLVEFLYKNPVLFEYSDSAALCHKFDFKKRVIYLSNGMRDSDLMLVLATARAAYIYRLHTITGLDTRLSEEEELAALFQARLGLQMNLVPDDFKKSEYATELKDYFCTYIMDEADDTRAKARKEALTKNPDCQRPLETLAVQQLWLDELKQAINDNTFARLLYARDLRRVRAGEITMNEAMKNDAGTRGMLPYDLYRFQQFYFDRQNTMLTNFVKYYSSELIEDGLWRQSNKGDLNRARTGFSDCNLPI